MAMFLFVFYPVSSQAAGMSDYILNITSGHKIVHNNSFDIGLVDNEGEYIYSPERGDKTGPISGYIVVPECIFLRTTGQKLSKTRNGGQLEEPDLSTEWFFIVERSDNSLDGPLTLEEFNSDANVASLSKYEWTVPRDPNPKRKHWIIYIYYAVILSVPIGLVILVIGVLFKIFERLHSPLEKK